MIVKTGPRAGMRPGEGHISGCEGIVSEEQFTPSECADLADLLEGLNVPGNQGTPLRRLTDMIWALQNDTSAFIVTSTEG